MTFEMFLKWISHLITVETFQTHGKLSHYLSLLLYLHQFCACPLTNAVAVYTLQALTDVLKAVRKSSIETQGMHDV